MSSTSTTPQKLPQLQNLIKRDPPSYRDEFKVQMNHFYNEIEILKLKPSNKANDSVLELINFMSHTSPCYKEDAAGVCRTLFDLMETNCASFRSDIRIKLLQALIMFRNKDVLDPLQLIKLAFKLFGINDKTLRLMLGEYIFNDIKTINQHKNNDKLNRSIQAVMFTVVDEDSNYSTRKAVHILADLYRRRVWTDARTINVLGKACCSSITAVMIEAVRFFLGIESKMEDDEEAEKEKLTKIEINYHEHSKKTKKRERMVEKQIERNRQIRKEKLNPTKVTVPLFAAIQLLYDPQTLAEKLFAKLKGSTEKFETKLMLMNFISRLICSHKLFLFNFYTFMGKYLAAHQQDVTQILAYLIQGCHDLVPPEELVPIVKQISYNFITERCRNEVIAVGINSVREIVNRVPTLLHQDGMDDLIQDLALYSKNNHKSVTIAASSMINLVRNLHPSLLLKKNRGKLQKSNKDAAMIVPRAYGDELVRDRVEGIELLEMFERGDIFINSDDVVVWREDITRKNGKGEEGGDDGWEDVDDDDSDDDDDDDDDENDEDADEEEDWIDVEEDDKVLAKVGVNDVETVGDEEEDGWEEVDDDDDDDNDDDDDDDDDNEKEGEEKRPPTPSPRIDMTRVLTAENFALLEKLKSANFERNSKLTSRRRSNVSSAQEAAQEDDDGNGANVNNFITSGDIAPAIRNRSSKIERITAVLEGRKENRFEKEKHPGGLTNKEKLRNKNYVMVRKGKKSVSSKINKSNSDKRYDQNVAGKRKKEIYGRDKRKRRRI